MKTKTVNLYEFHELDDTAKEKARERYRECALDYEWWDCIYEDAERIGLKITEFDLGGRKHIKGNLTTSVQKCCENITKEHGKDCATYKLAQQWFATSETLSQAIEALDDDTAEDERERLEAEQDEKHDEFEQALLEEYFVMLDHEYEWLLADEQVDESITANGYTFTEDGKRED